MGGAPLIIPLVGLVIPIALLICAALFDVGVLAWALYRVWHDRVLPHVVRLEDRTMIAARHLAQYALPHHR